MFDLTKYVQLKTHSQQTQYFFMRVLLFGVFFIVFTLFIKEVIFPTQTFQFKSSINSLANTISVPYESEDGTSFHVFAQGESNYAELIITLPKDSPNLPHDTTLLIKKSYLAFLSPINTKKYTDHIVKTYETDDAQYIKKQDKLHKFISKNAFDSYLFKDNVVLPDIKTEPLTVSNDIAGFAPASLISSKDSVYVIDGDTKHPFQDERAFLALGYNFENVISTNSEERSLHKKAKLFTTASTHPSGTLFYTTDSEKIYIFDNNLLNKLPLTSQAKQHAIPVEDISRITTESCILKKTIFPRQYKCKTPLDTIAKFHGNTYQFTLKDAPNTQIDHSKIKLFTTVNKKSLKNRIESIKRKIDTNYN